MADAPTPTPAPGILAGCPRCGARSHLEESTGHGDGKRQHSLWRVRCEAECYPAMETEWLPSAVAAARAWNAATPIAAHAAMPKAQGSSAKGWQSGPITPTARDIEAWRLFAEAQESAGGVRLGTFNWPQAVLSLIGALGRPRAVTWHPIDTAPHDRPVLLRGGKRWDADLSPWGDHAIVPVVAIWQAHRNGSDGWTVATAFDFGGNYPVAYDDPTEWAEVPK